MKACLLVVLLALAMTSFAKAQEPPDTQAMSVAHMLLDKTKGSRAGILKTMTQPMTALITKSVGNDAKARLIVEQAVMPVMAEHIDQLLDAICEQYTRIFSVAEMQSVLDFYDSPAGKKWFSAQAVLNEIGSGLTSQWAQQMQPEVNARIRKVYEENGWTYTGKL